MENYATTSMQEVHFISSMRLIKASGIQSIETQIVQVSLSPCDNRGKRTYRVEPLRMQNGIFTFRFKEVYIGIEDGLPLFQ